MPKISVATKVISFAVLIALMLTPFATATAVAKGGDPALEQKWDQLIGNYNRQSVAHNSVHHWADVWLMNHRDASSSDKSKIERHLVICNKALATATSIVMKHEGFESNGKVVHKNVARKTIKALNEALILHASSVRNLQAHIN